MLSGKMFQSLMALTKKLFMYCCVFNFEVIFNWIEFLRRLYPVSIITKYIANVLARYMLTMNILYKRLHDSVEQVMSLNSSSFYFLVVVLFLLVATNLNTFFSFLSKLLSSE